MNHTVQPFGMTFRGFYKVAIVDAASGEEVWRQPDWEKNLILNLGMDAIYGTDLNNITSYAIAGTGTRINSITSSESSGSAVGGVLYLYPIGSGIQDFSSSIYGGWSGSLGVGDVVKFNDGTEVTVTGSVPGTVVSDLSASIIPNTITADTQSFTIWKTSQTGLEQEVRRAGSTIATSSYLNGGCGTTFNTSSGLVTHLRTYDFGSESFTRDYSEVGVGWGVRSAIPNIFSRILLPQTVSVVNEQRLRLIYNLFVNFSPTSSVRVINVPISGWPAAPATNTNAIQCIQRLDGHTLSQINSDGTLLGTANRILEPAGVGGNCYMWGSLTSGSPAPMGSWVVRDAGVTTAAVLKIPYVTGSYECYKHYTFTVNQLSTSSIASVGVGFELGSIYSYGTGQAFCIAFEQTQSKTNTQTLAMFFRWNWGRILS